MLGGGVRVHMDEVVTMAMIVLIGPEVPRASSCASPDLRCDKSVRRTTGREMEGKWKLHLWPSIIMF